jgi:soluble lytic murein transglycosylase-like protein
MLRFVAGVLIVPLLLPTAGRAQEPAAETQERASTADKGEVSQAPREVQQSICLLMESAALSNELPVEFFVRLIWQESRFQTDAIGPRTRSGKHALGIAQFMPATAAEHNLLDPLDPIDALPKAAEFLKDLRHQFGNIGLAAAAYNAGPARVRQWMAGAASMPARRAPMLQV